MSNIKKIISSPGIPFLPGKVAEQPTYSLKDLLGHLPVTAKHSLDDHKTTTAELSHIIHLHAKSIFEKIGEATPRDASPINQLEFQIKLIADIQTSTDLQHYCPDLEIPQKNIVDVKFLLLTELGFPKAVEHYLKTPAPVDRAAAKIHSLKIQSMVRMMVKITSHYLTANNLASELPR